MDICMPSLLPPADLAVEDVPLFVAIGFDDNGHSGYVEPLELEGMRWATEAFSSRKNPDGSPCHCSFYCTTEYISVADSCEPVALVKRSWREALDRGFEIGNHTHSHSDGMQFSMSDWNAEINACVDRLTRPWSDDLSTDETGIGIDPRLIEGFRTPYLGYNAETFKAVQEYGFLYDCSIEEGVQADQDGRNFLWPYTLDAGSPGNQTAHADDAMFPLVGAHPGLWEIPCYVVITPPDDLCEHYGLSVGFRDRCAKLNPAGFDIQQGKITGLDYNCLVEYAMTADEFLATLMYTLDLRLAGNRAPFAFGGHTDVYARGYDFCPNITIAERRIVLEKFLDYALSKPMVRVVSQKELVTWMQNPTVLS